MYYFSTSKGHPEQTADHHSLIINFKGIMKDEQLTISGYPYQISQLEMCNYNV